MRDFPDPEDGAWDPGDGAPESGDGHPAGWISDGGAEATAASDAAAERAAAPDEGDLDALVRTAFDLLPTQVAVLDGEGTIVHTNRTWAAFGEANDIEGPADTVGVDYLSVCEETDDEHARRAAAGIRSVLSGRSDPFSMEYPCHGPDELRWFVMWARGFERGGDRHAVVVHLDVTARKLSELAVERRNADLEAVERIGELVREIVGSLGRETTRVGVERAVCERLTGEGGYAAAAVVDPTPEDGRFVVRERAVSASAADDTSFENTVDDDTLDDGTADLVRSALEAGETRVDREATAATPAGPTRDPAVVAAPLRHREAIYGVLAVTGRRPDAFDEREAAAFDVLGESAGFAIHAVETERFLHADDTLELRFRLQDGALPFFSPLGTREGRAVEFRDVVPGGEGVLVAYATVSGVPIDEVTSLAADVDAIASVRVIDEGAGDDGDGPARLEVRYRPPSPLHDVVAAGGAVRSCRVGADGGRLVAEVDDAATMRTVVDALSDDADLVGKRGQSGSAGGGDDDIGSDDVGDDADLTDRQRDALVAAHRGGYYEWPRRESTAEDLAAAMDVAPQTFHEHLRRAERKIVDRFLEDGRARASVDPE